MSEFENKDIPPLAKLEEEEALIPEDKVEEIEELIKDLPKPKEDETPNDAIVLDKPEKTGKGLGMVGDGAIGSTVVKSPAPRPKPKATPASEEDKVAIYSTKNVSWQGVGKVTVGFNIVTKEQSKKWLTRDHITISTPDEVAKGFGL